jgi:polyphosphate kinase 2 (PPK2 family)
LRENGSFPVIILISGVDGSGKGETINVLYEWMDPRYLSTHAFYAPTAEERARPSMWRYWRALPPKGRTGIFAGSWYSQPIAERISNDMSRSDFDQRMDQLNRFEAMLVNEGALVLKFWIHLSKDAQRERLKTIETNPLTRWRVTKASWDRLKTYDKMQEVAWPPAAHDQYALGAVDHRRGNRRPLSLADRWQDDPRVAPEAAGRQARPELAGGPAVLAAHRPSRRAEFARHDAEPDKKVYETELATWQGRLAELMRHPTSRSGPDSRFRRFGCSRQGRRHSAGDVGDGCAAVPDHPDRRPTEEERAQPYLWRFWRHMPRLGRVVIFDRTWFGRVLVERVEGFCSEADWLRAYAEINDFEHDIWHAGGIVIKFWLQISDEEQLKRFEERAQIEHKRFKITEEDWRNREKAEAYHEAVCDMVDRTSSGTAPWTIVESNDKYFARIKVLRTICERLERN